MVDVTCDCYDWLPYVHVYWSIDLFLKLEGWVCFMSWIQYSVVLTDGKDAGLERWIQCGEERLVKLVELLGGGDHCAFDYVPVSDNNDTRIGMGDSIVVDKRNLCIIASDEEVANEIAYLLKIPCPFYMGDGEFVLSRHRE